MPDGTSVAMSVIGNHQFTGVCKSLDLYDFNYYAKSGCIRAIRNGFAPRVVFNSHPYSKHTDKKIASELLLLSNHFIALAMQG